MFRPEHFGLPSKKDNENRLLAIYALNEIKEKITTDSPLNNIEREEIDHLIAVMQGKKPPDLLALIYAARFDKTQTYQRFTLVLKKMDVVYGREDLPLIAAINKDAASLMTTHKYPLLKAKL